MVLSPPSSWNVQRFHCVRMVKFRHRWRSRSSGRCGVPWRARYCGALRGPAAVDGHVQPLADEVAALRAQHEVQVQARVLVQQPWQPGRDEVLGRGQRGVDAHGARDLGVGHAHAGLGLLHRLHHLLARRAEALALLREADGARHALEQPHAQARLHARDELADRRGRLVQPAARAGKAAFLHHAQEHLQFAELVHEIPVKSVHMRFAAACVVCPAATLQNAPQTQNGDNANE